ncbi:MAG: InlB B-repeat-containing protein [Dehalococcoidia bacterium]|nr:InlB B-repeat-containing protein [Dehalococcoidia bacterium]
MKNSVVLFTVLLMISFVFSSCLAVSCTRSEEPNNSLVTVFYNGNGGSVLPGQATAEIGDEIILPKPTRGGHFFHGWFSALTEGAKIGDSGDTYKIEKTITLYAQWEQGITVYYQPNGGNVSPSSEVVLSGDVVTLPEPKFLGYTFDGWHNRKNDKVGDAGAKYSVLSNSSDIAVDSTGNQIIEFYAKWLLNVTVIFNLSGGSDQIDSQTTTIGAVITLPTPARAGYIFNGWYTSTSGGILAGNGGANYAIPMTSGSNHTLYARWIASEVTVTYDANLGTVTPSSQVVQPGMDFILPAATREGFIFNGWYSAISGGTRFGGAGDSKSVTTSVTLYAQWEPVVV